MNVAISNQGYSVFCRNKVTLKTTKNPEEESEIPYAFHWKERQVFKKIINCGRRFLGVRVRFDQQKFLLSVCGLQDASCVVCRPIREHPGLGKCYRSYGLFHPNKPNLGLTLVGFRVSSIIISYWMLETFDKRRSPLF